MLILKPSPLFIPFPLPLLPSLTLSFLLSLPPSLPLSSTGSITSTEVAGLQSNKYYYFKIGAYTSVGAGPFSPVKDVHTPPERYGERARAFVRIQTCLRMRAPASPLRVAHANSHAYLRILFLDQIQLNCHCAEYGYTANEIQLASNRKCINVELFTD